MKRNMSRRHFLKTGGLALAAMAMCPPLSFASSEIRCRSTFLCVLLWAKDIFCIEGGRGNY